MPTYRVAKNTKCLMYRRGSGIGWQPHRTIEDLEFHSHTPTDNGGYWLFQTEDMEWLFKIAPQFVEKEGMYIYEPVNQSDRKHMRKGKGASKRKRWNWATGEKRRKK